MSADMSWDDFPGPRHEDEIMAAHQGQPTPAQAVKMGVTPASGNDDTQGPMPGPIGAP